ARGGTSVRSRTMSAPWRLHSERVAALELFCRVDDHGSPCREIARRTHLGAASRRSSHLSCQRHMSRRIAVLVTAAGLCAACSKAPPATQPSPAQSPNQTLNRATLGGFQAQADTQGRGAGGAGGGAGPARPRPYNRAITRDAITRRGMFDVHRVADRLYFEIPAK